MSHRIYCHHSDWFRGIVSTHSEQYLPETNLWRLMLAEACATYFCFEPARP